MKDIWFISDTHFFHNNILKFTGKNGKLIRPDFKSVNEMNEVMRENWNKNIKPGDKVYHLGDVTMYQGEEFEKFFKTLNGRKRLILGNHDDAKYLAKFFDKILLWRVFKEYGFTASHIPLRLDSIRGFGRVNLHGHIHEKLMEEPNYINISVEQTKYSPVHLEDIVKQVEKIGKLHDH